MTRARSYKIWSVNHQLEHDYRGVVSSLADGTIKDPDTAAKYILGGRWWVNLQEVADKYKFIYCETLTGNKRSKLYRPEDFIREQRQPRTFDPFR